jgi:hypothetical protein
MFFSYPPPHPQDSCDDAENIDIQIDSGEGPISAVNEYDRILDSGYL